MYRMRNFIFIKVVGSSGKNLGFVGDIILDFNSRLIKGFTVVSNNILKKDTNVYIQDTLSIEPILIASKLSSIDGLKFNDIRSMDVVDDCGDIIGRIEDIIFYERDFSIKAFVISQGLIYDIFYGRKIIPIQNLILGDKNILYRDNKICKWREKNNNGY